MTWYKKTRTVADHLRVSYWSLFNLIRTNQLTPPGKDSSGDYCWLPEDVERARQVVEARRGRRKAVTA